jgi:streptomycin 6-kinase
LPLSCRPVVRRKAEAIGAAGQAWLAGLADLIADLERRWSVTLERQLGGGTAAYVARARTPDGHHLS